jgi:hypothetical protein
MDTGATLGQHVQVSKVSKGTLVAVFFMKISAGLDIVPHIYFLRQLEMF